MSRSPSRHRFTILEEEKYRLQRTLSDVNGIDPCIHNGTVRGMISCILSQMRRSGRNPTVEEVSAIYRLLRKAAAKLKKDYSRQTIFTRAIFEELVEAAALLADARGLLSR